MNDSLFNPASVLSEQVARQIFEILPESRLVMVILDKDGNCWPSDSEAFSRLHLDESYLRQVCQKIDDGHEPVVTQSEECSIVAAQLATSRTNCGYVIIAMPQYNPESALVNIDLIEILLNQVTLTAKLLEKNNMLYELLLQHHVVATGSGVPQGSFN